MADSNDRFVTWYFFIDHFKYQNVIDTKQLFNYNHQNNIVKLLQFKKESVFQIFGPLSIFLFVKLPWWSLYWSLYWSTVKLGCNEQHDFWLCYNYEHLYCQEIIWDQKQAVFCSLQTGIRYNRVWQYQWMGVIRPCIPVSRFVMFGFESLSRTF